jgi:hypothetical protein
MLRIYFDHEFKQRRAWGLKKPIMTKDEFWSLIDQTRNQSSGDPYRQAELLVEALAKLPEQEIIAYYLMYREIEDHAYVADLWDAASILDSWGCSEDGFKDFRAWLIAQGKTVYTDVLADPESLLDIVSPGMETQIEELSYVASWAYQKKTNTELDLRHADYVPPKLKGELAQTPEMIRRKFPRLMAKFRDSAN